VRSHELANILLSAPDARIALLPVIKGFEAPIRGIARVSHGFYGSDDVIVLQPDRIHFGYESELRNLIQAVAIPGIQTSPMGKRIA